MEKNFGKTANTILVAVTLGFIITYPMNFNFWGKLLSSGFCAAMIGGVADWFGVTALFRRPLGIPFRTEIIVKNREKIFDSLVYMIENELLTKDNIKNKINEYSISTLLKDYMLKHGGKKNAAEIIEKFINDMVYKADLKVLGKSLEELTIKSISEIEIIPVFLDIYEWSSKKGYTGKIYNFIFTELESIAKASATRNIMIDLVDHLLNRLKDISKSESFGTKLQLTSILIVVKLFGISSEKVADKILEYALTYLRDLKYPLNPKRLQFEKSVDKWIYDCKYDKNKQLLLENRIKNYLLTLNLSNYIEKYVDSLKQKIIQSDNNGSKLNQYIETLLERLIFNFQNSTSQQAYIDQISKKAFMKLVEDKHNEIGKAVKERLDRFSDEELVEILESRIGKDLQIIRINGSVVGGLTGILSFLVTYFIFGR